MTADLDALAALVAKARTMIVEVAADLATGKWLLSEYREDHEGMVTKETMRKIRAQNDAMRRQAIKLRAAFDTLPDMPALIARVRSQEAALVAADELRKIVPVGRQGTVGPGIELSREAKIAHAYDAARGSRG